jgi:hypothetical protein
VRDLKRRALTLLVEGGLEDSTQARQLLIELERETYAPGPMWLG